MQKQGQVEVAPEKQTHELRTTLSPFELLGTAIAQRVVQTLAVVEALDILRDGMARLGLVLKLPLVDQLIFQ